jgi:hypothetical protein
MKKPLILAAIAVTLAAGVAIAASRPSGPAQVQDTNAAMAKLLTAIPVPGPPVLPIYRLNSQPVWARLAAHAAPQLEKTQQSPGLYLAAPYACLVLVPQKVDSAMVVAPAVGTQADNCIVIPRLRLEPKK